MSERASDWEKCAREKLAFNDKAAVAIYLYADVAFKEEAQEALKKLREVCSAQIPEVRRVSAEDLEELIGWDGLYNDEVRIMAEEFGFKTVVDDFGAYCWVDDYGNKICGDQSGFFPFYSLEKLLRKRMTEGKVVV